MSTEQALAFVLSLNPGFWVIACAPFALIAQGGFQRCLALIGPPILALLIMLYPPAEVSSGTAVLGFLGLEISLYRTDSLSLIFALGFVLAAVLGGIYSLHRRDRLQDAAGLVYAGAAIAAVFAGDLVTLAVCWELTALASSLLVFASGGRDSLPAGMRYLMMQILSGVLLISGVAMTGLAEGSFILSEIGRLQDGVLVGVFDLDAPGTLLILAAVGIKAGFPLVHTWLQDAYPNTTETGAVVMSAYTTTLAVYVLARGFAGLDALIWIGAVMTIYPIFFAVLENDLRKVLAFSTNNQIGFMVCAVGVGTPLALNGAAAHAVAHIVFKGLLFMAMGAVWMRTGSTRATDLGGLHRTMPFTALFCLIGAASISALPLLSGFASKSMIMSSVHSGEGLMLIWLMLLFASAGVLEHSGIKIPYFAFFSHDSGRRPEEAPFNMLLAMGLSAGLCLSIGISPAWFYELLPYRDVAREYLVQDLFTLEHILTQLQLLAFAVLAFLLLKRAGLYPPEAPGIILDVDWVWRRGWPLAAGPVRAPVLGVLRSVAAAGRDVLGRVGAMMAEVFSPAGTLASRASAVSGAVWAVALLGIVVIISVVSLT